MLQKLVLVLIFGCSLGVPARAENMVDATLVLCEKIKTCALAQIAQQDFTPEMRQMMEPMLNGMCARVQSQITDVPTGHSLYGPALSCMKSMEALSCADLRDGDQLKTPECEAYEEASKKYNSKP
jgi:hypothetical protein